MVQILNKSYLKAIGYFKESIELSGWSQKEIESVTSNYDNIIYCCILAGDTILARKWTELKMADKRTFASRAKDFVTLARYELIEKHLSKGEQFLKKAILCDSTTFEAYVGLANIEMIRNNLDLAEEFLDKCFKIKMDYPQLYQSFILLSLYQEDLETARYFINKLLKNEPYNPFALDVKKDFLE
ncbi:MAG: tetratricopeptide repeat protein [Draconibacterium sp.]